MSITMIKIRAKITIGSLVVQTPFIRSFSVNKTRGQVSNFNAVLKVPYEEVADNITGNNVVIEAGENSPNIKVFTGMVRQAKISPCFDDPHFVDLSVSGTDKLVHLQGKKFTRRCRSTRTSYVTINSVVRPGLRSGYFKYIEQPVIEITSDVPIQNGDITYANKTVVSTTPNNPDRVPIGIIASGVRIEGEE